MAKKRTPDPVRITLAGPKPPKLPAATLKAAIRKRPPVTASLPKITMPSIATSGLVEAAKQITDRFGRDPALKSALDRAAAQATAPLNEAMRKIVKDWDTRAEALQAIQRDALSVRSLSVMPVLPSPEVSASRAIEAQTERLVEISIRTSEQIGQLAQLAEDALAQQIQATLTAAQMREDAKGAARNMTWLTVAIVILTAVLVAIALKLGPFAGV